jgi:hypothetical protein
LAYKLGFTEKQFLELQEYIAAHNTSGKPVDFIR